MTLELDVQNASASASIPTNAEFHKWANAALAGMGRQMLTIRVVDVSESADLNLQFRTREGPTNVLSFSADLPDELDVPLLGDIVICAPLVDSEAAEQGKQPEAHWAHLVIHGVLHLLGMDHQLEAEANEMESCEKAHLASLGYPDPYA